MKMTRNTIEQLCSRLDEHAEILDRFPTVRADVRLAAAVLRAIVAKTGVPIGAIEVALEDNLRHLPQPPTPSEESLPAVSFSSQHNS
jgi:hypothetical protein